MKKHLSILCIFFIFSGLILLSCQQKKYKKVPDVPPGTEVTEVKLDELNYKILSDSLDPDNYYNRSLYYIERKDINKALSDIGKAIELNDKDESFLFDLCITIWQQIDKKPSVRFNAVKFMVKIAKKHPKLSQEINCLMQDQYLESLSPGARKSVCKMVKEVVR